MVLLQPSLCRFTCTNCWLAWPWFHTHKFSQKSVAKFSVCIQKSIYVHNTMGNFRVCSIAFLNTFFRYAYRLGHLLPDGSYIWSKKYSFKSSPYPGQDSLQRVVIFGDMGKVTLIVSKHNLYSREGRLSEIVFEKESNMLPSAIFCQIYDSAK